MAASAACLSTQAFHSTLLDTSSVEYNLTSSTCGTERRSSRTPRVTPRLLQATESRKSYFMRSTKSKSHDSCLKKGHLFDQSEADQNRVRAIALRCAKSALRRIPQPRESFIDADDIASRLMVRINLQPGKKVNLSYIKASVIGLIKDWQTKDYMLNTAAEVWEASASCQYDLVGDLTIENLRKRYEYFWIVERHIAGDTFATIAKDTPYSRSWVRHRYNEIANSLRALGVDRW